MPFNFAPTSPQQNKMIHQIRLRYPSLPVVLNFRVKIPNKSHSRFLDAAIEPLKLDFEYDGKKNHTTLGAKLKDKYRDEELKALGWETFRVTAKNWKMFFDGGLLDQIIKMRMRELGIKFG